jgi:hypothetical protein
LTAPDLLEHSAAANLQVDSPGYRIRERGSVSPIGLKIGDDSIRCLTPELRTIGEIEWYEKHLIADLKAAFDDAKARFRRQEKQARRIEFL